MKDLRDLKAFTQHTAEYTSIAPRIVMCAARMGHSLPVTFPGTPGEFVTYLQHNYIENTIQHTSQQCPRIPCTCQATSRKVVLCGCWKS